MLQAKTDGALFLTITLCNLMIYSLIKNHSINYKEKVNILVCFGYWCFIKGSNNTDIYYISINNFSVIKRKNFLKEIFSYLGLILFLALVLPWFIMITIESKAAFWYESVGSRFARKSIVRSRVTWLSSRILLNNYSSIILARFNINLPVY